MDLRDLPTIENSETGRGKTGRRAASPEPRVHPAQGRPVPGRNPGHAPNRAAAHAPNRTAAHAPNRAASTPTQAQAGGRTPRSASHDAAVSQNIPRIPANAPIHANPQGARMGVVGAAGHAGHAGAAFQESPQKRSAKTIAVVVAAVVLVLACAGVAAAMILGNKPAPVEQDLAIEPTTIGATVKANNVMLKGPQFDRGTAITNIEPASDLTGEAKDKYYKGTVDGEVVYVPIEEVRLATEADPDPWTGFATEDATVYANGDLSGSDIQTLVLNDEITVLDKIGNLYFVRTADDFEGYIPADRVSREKIEKKEEEPADEGGSNTYYSYDYGYTGGGNGGGNSGGGGGGGYTPPTTPTTPSGPADGDDMTMPTAFTLDSPARWFGIETAFAEEATSSAAAPDGSSASGSGASTSSADAHSGKILKSNCQSYYAILNRGDAVVVKVDDLYDFAEPDEQGESSDSSSGSSSAASASDETLAGTAGNVSAGHLSSEERELLAQEQATSTTNNTSEAPPVAGTASASNASSGSDVTENMCTIIVNGNEVLIEECLLRLDEGTPYSDWEGYAEEGAVLYSDYALKIKAADLKANDKILVIDAIGDTLVVEFDGKIYYMGKSLASKQPVEVAEEPEAEEQTPTDPGQTYYEDTYYYGGGNSGGGGNGGGGSTPSTPTTPTQPSNPSGGDEWTPPAM